MTEEVDLEPKVARELAKLRRRKNWSWVGMIGALVYEALINPLVPYGPLLVRTVPGWNIYLGDVPTLVFAGIGVGSLALYFRSENQRQRLAASRKTH